MLGSICAPSKTDGAACDGVFGGIDVFGGDGDLAALSASDDADGDERPGAEGPTIHVGEGVGE
eukprot:8391479-Pyramimonas_sp.AAC.1